MCADGVVLSTSDSSTSSARHSLAVPQPSSIGTTLRLAATKRLDRLPVEPKQHEGLDGTVGVGVQFGDGLEAAARQSPGAVGQRHLLAGQLDHAGEAWLPELRRLG